MGPGRSTSAMRALAIVLAAKFALGNVWCESGWVAESVTKCPEFNKRSQGKGFNNEARKKEVCGPSDCKDLHDKLIANCTNEQVDIRASLDYFRLVDCETTASQWCKGGYWTEDFSKCPVTAKEIAKETPDENAIGKEWCEPGSCKDFLDKIVADCADAPEVADYRGQIIQMRKACGGFALGVWCESGWVAESATKCPEFNKRIQGKDFNNEARKKEACGPSECKELHDKLIANCTNEQVDIRKLLEYVRNGDCETTASLWCKGGYGTEQPTKCPVTTKEIAKMTLDQNAIGKEWCEPGSCKDFHDKIVAECADAPEVADYRGQIIQKRKACGRASVSNANGLRFGFPGSWTAVVGAIALMQ